MHKTRVLLKCVRERLVGAVADGSKRPSLPLNGFQLRRTANLTFLKTGLKIHTKNSDRVCPQEPVNTWHMWIITTHSQNKSNYISLWWKKKERPNFCGIFLQNLLISTDFTATIKVTLPLCNGIGVRPLPGLRTCCEQNTSHCLDRLTSLSITRTNTTYINFYLFNPKRITKGCTEVERKIVHKLD